jgi:hypothetical protein
VNAAELMDILATSECNFHSTLSTAAENGIQIDQLFDSFDNG